MPHFRYSVHLSPFHGRRLISRHATFSRAAASARRVDCNTRTSDCMCSGSMVWDSEKREWLDWRELWDAVLSDRNDMRMFRIQEGAHA